MAEGFIGSQDSVFTITSSLNTAAAPEWAGDFCCGQEAESSMGWRRQSEVRLVSGRRHLAWASNGLLPGRLDSRGCCSSCRKEGEAVCCMLLHVASRPLSRTDAVFES